MCPCSLSNLQETMLNPATQGQSASSNAASFSPGGAALQWRRWHWLLECKPVSVQPCSVHLMHSLCILVQHAAFLFNSLKSAAVSITHVTNTRVSCDRIHQHAYAMYGVDLLPCDNHILPTGPPPGMQGLVKPAKARSSALSTALGRHNASADSIQRAVSKLLQAVPPGNAHDSLTKASAVFANHHGL